MESGVLPVNERQELIPRSKRVSVLVGKALGDLMDVVLVMRNPGREEVLHGNHAEDGVGTCLE